MGGGGSVTTVRYLQPELIATFVLLIYQSLASHFVKSFCIEDLLWSPQTPYARPGLSSSLEKEAGDGRVQCLAQEHWKVAK